VLVCGEARVAAGTSPCGDVRRENDRRGARADHEDLITRERRFCPRIFAFRTALDDRNAMNNINPATLKKGLEAGQKAGEKIVVQVSNLCTHFRNTFSPPKCDTLRLLQKAEFDLAQLCTRTDLSNSQRTLLEKLRPAIRRMSSCKAIAEKKVGKLALSLTSSLKGLGSRMLNFEHVEEEFTLVLDYFNQTFFEARYGDYIFCQQGRVDLEKYSFQPSPFTHFTDPEELVKQGDFENLAKRVAKDLVDMETDFDQLPSVYRNDAECCAAIEEVLMNFRNRYFRSLNIKSEDYQLSEYGQTLLSKKEERENDIATEALEEGIEAKEAPSTQPLGDFEILEDEIYICDGLSRTTTDEEDMEAESDHTTDPEVPN
jgi:hypothetical protein